MLRESLRRDFEARLVRHCGPALTGLKVSNLISFTGREREEYGILAEKYGRMMFSRGIRFRVLCQCDRNMLLLVYNLALMNAALSQKRTAAILNKAGYPTGDCIDEMLDYLTERISGDCAFPHEIGLFLGYPAEDVEGFIAKGGKEYIYCGYWKVYSDADKAKRIFESYDRCISLMQSLLNRGVPLPRLLNII